MLRVQHALCLANGALRSASTLASRQMQAEPLQLFAHWTGNSGIKNTWPGAAHSQHAGDLWQVRRVERRHDVSLAGGVAHAAHPHVSRLRLPPADAHEPQC